jgi:hypothetical protein
MEKKDDPLQAPIDALLRQANRVMSNPTYEGEPFVVDTIHSPTGGGRWQITLGFQFLE